MPVTSLMCIALRRLVGASGHVTRCQCQQIKQGKRQSHFISLSPEIAGQLGYRRAATSPASSSIVFTFDQRPLGPSSHVRLLTHPRHRARSTLTLQRSVEAKRRRTLRECASRRRPCCCPIPCRARLPCTAPSVCRAALPCTALYGTVRVVRPSRGSRRAGGDLVSPPSGSRRVTWTW